MHGAAGRHDTTLEISCSAVAFERVVIAAGRGVSRVSPACCRGPGPRVGPGGAEMAGEPLVVRFLRGFSPVVVAALTVWGCASEDSTPDQGSNGGQGGTATAGRTTGSGPSTSSGSGSGMMG